MFDCRFALADVSRMLTLGAIYITLYAALKGYTIRDASGDFLCDSNVENRFLRDLAGVPTSVASKARSVLIPHSDRVPLVRCVADESARTTHPERTFRVAQCQNSSSQRVQICQAFCGAANHIMLSRSEGQNDAFDSKNGMPHRRNVLLPCRRGQNMLTNRFPLRVLSALGGLKARPHTPGAWGGTGACAVIPQQAGRAKMIPLQAGGAGRARGGAGACAVGVAGARRAREATGRTWPGRSVGAVCA